MKIYPFPVTEPITKMSKPGIPGYLISSDISTLLDILEGRCRPTSLFAELLAEETDTQASLWLLGSRDEMKQAIRRCHKKDVEDQHKKNISDHEKLLENMESDMKKICARQAQNSSVSEPSIFKRFFSCINWHIHALRLLFAKFFKI